MTITVGNPQQAEFSISPIVFCGRDKGAKTFHTLPPVKDMQQVSNPDGMKLAIQNGVLSFVPAVQNVSGEKSFKLEYLGKQIAIKIIDPFAGFTMQYESKGVLNDVTQPLLTLRSKQKGGENQWQVTLPSGGVLNFTGPIVVLQYNQFGANNQFVQLEIVHTISFQKQTGVDCADSKHYLLTPLITRNHADKGEFDNETSN